MTVPILIGGTIFGSLLAALVGLVGSKRRIGFGWVFLISVIFSPLVGLVCALLSEKLPYGEKRWGCLGTLLGIAAIILIVFLALVLIMGLFAV